jgi:DNA-binding CsgD family transcriptional regulator
MSVTELVRARDRMLAAVRSDRSEAELLPEVIAALHDVALFDWCALVRTDPETMLPSTGAVEGFEEHMCVTFWDNELLDPDFVKFNELARSHDPVATLHEATDGDLARSPRYQKLYRHIAADDELRVAFMSGTTCWAVATLVRPACAGPFTAEEINAVRELAPVATRALRTAASKADQASAVAGPAMLVIGSDGSIESTTAGAEAMLVDLRTHGIPGSMPTAVLAAARRAKSSRSSTRIAVRAQGASGRWMKLHASPLGDDGRVAVMIETARATDLVPILLESYGLTERETEVVFLLARGLSSKEAAAELCISPHTVNDHIKVIFTKVGVSSRGELVARLFADHLFESYHESHIRIPTS